MASILIQTWHADLVGRDNNFLFPTIVQTASSQHPLSRIHPLWSDFILSRGHHTTSHCTDTGVA